mmetsp:Transcript_26153/g.76457  ORF Transcript_26153/g.76457 Transcript_26153/m.76457 type:complete len:229 (+) Transcript_26153:95-781(+)
MVKPHRRRERSARGFSWPRSPASVASTPPPATKLARRSAARGSTGWSLAPCSSSSFRRSARKASRCVGFVVSSQATLTCLNERLLFSQQHDTDTWTLLSFVLLSEVTKWTLPFTKGSSSMSRCSSSSCSSHASAFSDSETCGASSGSVSMKRMLSLSSPPYFQSGSATPQILMLSMGAATVPSPAGCSIISTADVHSATAAAKTMRKMSEIVTLCWRSGIVERPEGAA